MSSSPFDSLEQKFKEFPLPSKAKIKLIPLDVFQRIEFIDDLKHIKKKSDTPEPERLYRLYQKWAKLCVVNDDLYPYMSDKDIKNLTRYDNGNLLAEVFGEIMKLSGLNLEAEADAKKKSETPTSK